MTFISRTAAAIIFAPLIHCSVWAVVPGFDRENCTVNGTKLVPSACESLRATYEANEAFALRQKQDLQARAEIASREREEATSKAERERLRPPPPPEKPVVHDWRPVEAANGAVYRVDLASVQRFSTGAGGAKSASVMMYPDEGSSRDIHAQRLYVFDCKGHMQDANSMSAPTYIPPRSVAANVAALVCAVELARAKR